MPIKHKWAYVGIDPGFDGAIAVLDADGNLFDVYDMPTNEVEFTKNGKVKARREINPHAVLNILLKYETLYAGIEEVNARPGQGVTSMFRFGHGLGLLEGIMVGYYIPYMTVRPAEWKKQFGLVGFAKDAAIEKARSLFPAAELTLKKHHGRADALLIAKYAFSKRILERTGKLA